MGWIIEKLAPYKLLLTVVSALAAVAAIIFLWTQFTGHYIDQGKAMIQPKLDAAIIQRDDAINKTYQWSKAYTILSASAKVCSDSVDSLKADSEKRKKEAIEASKKTQAIVVYRDRVINSAEAHIASPDAHLKDCQQAVVDSKLDIGGEK